MKSQWYLNDDGTLNRAAYEVAFDSRRDARLYSRKNPMNKRWRELLRCLKAARTVC